MTTLAFSRGSFVVLAIFLLLSCFQDHLLSEVLVLEQKFSGAVVTEMKVNLPADELWAVYRSPEYVKLLAMLQPDIYKSVTYVSGDGGVGTIVQVTVSTKGEDEYWYDNITKIDDKTKTRVQTQLRGRFRNSGFTYFASEYHVIKTGMDSSIMRFSLLFYLKQESLSNVTLVIKTWDPANIIADYVNSARSTPVVLHKEFGGEIVADMHVNLPANELWHEYRRLDFPYLLLRIMSYYYKQIIFENGNGDVGTLFNVTLQPGYGSLHYVEQNILIDDKVKTRAIRFAQGGPLDSGVTKFVNAFIVIPDTRDSSVIRAFGIYKIKPESLSNASSLQSIWDHGIAMAKYTLSKIT